MFDETFIPTLSPEEPEKPEDTEKEAPAPADTAKEEAPDEKPEEKEQVDEKPALILGKFKSQADLEKAYKEIERKYGKTSSELAALKTKPEKHEKPAESEKDELEDIRKMDPQAWVNALYEGPKAVLDLVDKVVDKRTKAIREQVQTQRYETEVERFRRVHPDVDEYAEEMSAWIEEHPRLAREPDALEMAYKSARLDRLEAALPRIGEDTVKDKVRSGLDKQAARMPGGGRQTSKEPSVEDSMREALLVEDKKARGIFG